jgi:uncharacterized protein YecE (DUF72 family)
MKDKYSIGCSGYYYPSWKNKFYPAGTPPKNWLQYYSTVFNTVELNGTFYRTPKLSDLQKYAAVTAENFTFSVKMSRYITHVQKLAGSKEPVSAFQSLINEGLGKKLAHFLFQMPPSFHYSEENMEHIISVIPHKPQNVIEFRHSSWWNEDVRKALTKAKITFCNVDFPGLASKFMHTTDHFYLRLHGNPDLFKSSYSDNELKGFCKQFPAESKVYTIYFNNTFYEAGYTNAMQLQNITKQ